jgi:hypothetical protein
MKLLKVGTYYYNAISSFVYWINTGSTKARAHIYEYMMACMNM